MLVPSAHFPENMKNCVKTPATMRIKKHEVKKYVFEAETPVRQKKYIFAAEKSCSLSRRSVIKLVGEGQTIKQANLALSYMDTGGLMQLGKS